MESKRASARPYPLHFRDWRKPDRFCGQKDHECPGNRARLALGHRLYPAHHDPLAIIGAGGKYFFRAIPVFHAIY